ncbi:MAG: hypothetical protein WCS73_07735 [Lentisphaeria bacterium]
MLCDRCHKEEACLHIRGFNQDGVMTSINLCAKCALKEFSKKGDGSDHQLADLIEKTAKGAGLELLDLLESQVLPQSERGEKNRACAGCKKKRSQLEMDYHLGCLKCVDSFDKYIRHRVDAQFDYKSLQISLLENKENPQVVITKKEKAFQQLRFEFDRAVKKEEYERAAELCKQLDVMAEQADGPDKKGASSHSKEKLLEPMDSIFENAKLPWIPTRIQSGPVISLSSFVRAERNLDGLELPPFNGKNEDAEKAVEQLKNALNSEPLLGKTKFYDPQSMDRDSLAMLHEHGWCRPEFFFRAHRRGIMVSENARIIHLINQDNHLETTTWGTPETLPEMTSSLQKIIENLSRKLTFWHKDYGYITKDIRNIGTGIRLGGVMHLPGICMSEKMPQVIQACQALGVTLVPKEPPFKYFESGLYVYCNSSCRNTSVENLVRRLDSVRNLLIEHEMDSRNDLQRRTNFRLKVCDQVGRAWGNIKGARLLSPAEAKCLLSVLWLGFDLGMLPELSMQKIFQAYSDASFYNLGPLYKRILPSGSVPEKLLAARLRHDLAGISQPE